METRVVKNQMMFRFLLVVCVSITCTYASDTVSANQTVRYPETIVSQDETFELGFFSPRNTKNHYVGIWYKKMPKQAVVWVANHNTPLTDTSGELTLNPEGVLILRNGSMGKEVWSSAKSSTKSVRNPIGKLLNTGNFIICEDGDVIHQENLVWQSFDFLTNTLLPHGMLGLNSVTGKERHLTSWKSENDPAFGGYSYSIDTRARAIGYPQAILKKGSNITFRVSPWSVTSDSILVLQSSGKLEYFRLSDVKQSWEPYNFQPRDLCDTYSYCGPFEICNISNPAFCECLKGFNRTSTDRSQGCQHIIPLDCNPEEGFHKYSNLKLPDTQGSRYSKTTSCGECEKMCKSDCSCTAYAILATARGCLLWFGNLTDMRTIDQNGGDTLYIRLSASQLDPIENSRSSCGGRSKRIRVIVPVAIVVLLILVSVALFYRFNRKRQQQQGARRNTFRHDPENSGDEDLELPLFGLSTLIKATNSFSINNKLGEGGFGPVYKGVLEDGQEIAVKQLAKTSTQGFEEFKNEVISISKLQHRNLVKLLGCCIEGAEKLLIYEYMPNKGLDSFIFDKTQSHVLDWPTRYNIINGIARGLLYLHQDSRLRIIHRDLKVSNILLDMDMNPKISDFGMARTFGGNQIEANTNRVVGTYGYMAPEYAGDGIFSIKSDVYSFGVLVLEIVCGERNRRVIHREHYTNLIGHAWRLHNEGRSLQLIAKCLSESINVSQVLRSIHVALLCVQRHQEDRPNMTSVILMLGSESTLPSPKEPGFFARKTKEDATTESSSSYATSANNELSISMLKGR